MHRIDSDGAQVSIPTPDAVGSTVGYFQPGNPNLGQRATVVTADWANAVQEEIAKVIETGGSAALSKTSRDQMYNAIVTMIAAGPGLLQAGRTKNLGLKNDTTTDSNDSITIMGAAATLSSTNKAYVAINHATNPGRMVELYATADVKIKISGALWNLNTYGDQTGLDLRVYAINDNGTLKWGVALQGGLSSISDSNSSQTPSSVSAVNKMLVNSTLSSGTWPCVEVGWFKASFTDSTDKWVVSTTIGEICVGRPVKDHFDDTSFTMTVTGSTSNPTKATTREEIAVYSRRGKMMKVHYEYWSTDNTGAAAGSGTYIFTLPGGWQVDQGSVVAPSQNGRGVVGVGMCRNASSYFHGNVMMYSKTSVSLKFWDTSNASGNNNDVGSGTTPMNAGTGVAYVLDFEVPILGWSSN